MAKVLVLAKSGFGKSTSIGETKNEELGIDIKGLNPKETYVISMTSKPLPFAKSAEKFKVTTIDAISKGNRIICSNPDEVVKALNKLIKSPVKEIVLDDFNYLMQDWYMDNALAKGWDAPKTIGFFMGQIFKCIELLDRVGKNVYVLAHGEEVQQPDGRIYIKMKTTGKMVDEYVTPEGKFDITLLGISSYDTNEGKVLKYFITNEDEFYSSAKSAIGMFPIKIPNDLGLVSQGIKKFYN